MQSKDFNRMYAKIRDLNDDTILDEGVWSDLWHGDKKEKKQDQANKDAFDAYQVDKWEKKFLNQGIEPEDARKYAFRKVHGSPDTEKYYDEDAITIDEKVDDTWNIGDKFIINADDDSSKKLTVEKIVGNKLLGSDGNKYSKYGVTKFSESGMESVQEYVQQTQEGDGRKKGIHGKGHPMRKKQQAAIHAGESVGEGYTVFPELSDHEKERYRPRDEEGLEGPFRLHSGKFVYYDKKEGKYYDPDTDFFMSDEDYAVHSRSKNEESIVENPTEVTEVYDGGKTEVQSILAKHPEEAKKMTQAGDIYEIYGGDLYMALFQYFSEEGMPYGTQKGRDGDPVEYMNDELDTMGLLESIVAYKVEEGTQKPYVSLTKGTWIVTDGNGNDVDGFDNKETAFEYLEKNYDELMDPKPIRLKRTQSDIDYMKQMDDSHALIYGESRNTYFHRGDKEFKFIPEGYKKTKTGKITKKLMK